jgi:hypothetical protein
MGGLDIICVYIQIQAVRWICAQDVLLKKLRMTVDEGDDD